MPLVTPGSILFYTMDALHKHRLYIAKVFLWWWLLCSACDPQGSRPRALSGLVWGVDDVRRNHGSVPLELSPRMRAPAVKGHAFGHAEAW